MPKERPADDLEALARQVRTARQIAGLSIDAAAETAGMSPVTWGRVEKAQPVRALSYVGIERVLGWAPGSIERVLDGGGPLPISDSDGPGDCEVAIRKIEDVLDFRGIGAGMALDTIRGIVANYRRAVPRPDVQRRRRSETG